jgi:hypothetical protein
MSDDNAGMTSRSRLATACIVASDVACKIALGVIVVANIWLGSAHAQTPSAQKGTPMSVRATGPFEVKLTPQDDKLDSTLGRMTIDKTFHGDLEATSKGQMLTASTDVKGSAGYVAVERVTGSLRTPSGVRAGGFALQHIGTLIRGTPQLSVTVVPDSGTGQLVGLTGKMDIIIDAGKHSYDFEYSLPETNQ